MPKSCEVFCLLNFSLKGKSTPDRDIYPEKEGEEEDLVQNLNRTHVSIIHPGYQAPAQSARWVASGGVCVGGKPRECPCSVDNSPTFS